MRTMYSRIVIAAKTEARQLQDPHTMLHVPCKSSLCCYSHLSLPVLCSLGSSPGSEAAFPTLC